MAVVPVRSRPVTAPDANSAPPPVPAEVFVDDSGRRRRILVRVGYLLGAGCLLYVALLGVSFAGGPIGPHALLPLPGLPEKVDDPLGISGLTGVGAPAGHGADEQPDGTRGTRTATPRATATRKPTAAPRAATESLVKLTPTKPTSTGAPAGTGSTDATPTPTPEAGTTTPPADPTPPPADPPPSPTDSPSTESAPTNPPTPGTAATSADTDGAGAATDGAGADAAGGTA
jgi:hypothetical protein